MAPTATAIRPLALRALEHPRARWAIVAIAALVAVPSIAIGFFSDDYALRAELLGRLPYNAPFYDLYRFTPDDPSQNLAILEAGACPWWTTPRLHIHLLRPLTSVLFALDAKLFGAAPLGYHLHSILWYVALVAAASALLRRVLPGATGTLAALLYAVHEAHVFPFGWASCRHTTIAATFSMLALSALVRDREDGWRAGRWAAAGALAAGLAGGESALGGVAFALAYAALGGTRREAPRARLALAAPVLVVSAIYAVVYAALGGGAAHSAGYLSPITDPGGFAVAAARRLPAMLADATLSVPGELANVAPFVPLAAAGVAGTAAVALVVRALSPALSSAERLALRWLVPGAFVALLSTLGGFPGARLLVVPNLGVVAVFAIVARHGFAHLGARGAARVARRAAAGFFAFLHLVAAPIGAQVNVHIDAAIGRRLEGIAGELAAMGQPGDRFFVLTASDPMAGIYPPWVLAVDAPGTIGCWSTASAAKASHRVTRTGPSSLLVEPIDATLLRGPFEALYRPPGDPLRLGDVVRQCGATYRIAGVRDGMPSKVELELDVPLDDARVHVLAWQDGRLAKVALPAVGETMTLPWSPGPIGLF